jgi:hypothetical protein
MIFVDQLAAQEIPLLTVVPTWPMLIKGGSFPRPSKGGQATVRVL